MLALCFLTGCLAPTAAGRAAIATPAPDTRTIAVAVNARGFSPASFEVETGSVATVVFTRTVEHTCVKRVVLGLDAEHTVERDLPRNQPVAITLQFDRPGELSFSCAMGMRFGSIHVVDHLARSR